MDTSLNKKRFYKKLSGITLLTLLLALCSIYTQYRFSQSKSLPAVKVKLEVQIKYGESKFKQFTGDTNFIKSTLNSIVEKSSYLQEDITNQVGLFVYKVDSLQQPKLVFWNSTKYFINEDLLNHTDTNFFSRDINGDFELIYKSIIVDGAKIMCVGVIPIKWHYFIENTYLKSTFNNKQIPENIIAIKDTATNTSIEAGNGKHLFYIDYANDAVVKQLDTLTVVLRFAVLFIILLLIYLYATLLYYTKGFLQSFSFLIIALLFLRVLIYTMPTVFYSKDILLFDPVIYGSNAVNSSLGNLMINVLLMATVVHFYYRNVQNNIVAFKWLQGWKRVLFKLVILVAGLFGFIHTIKHIILDSKIYFDVSNFSSLSYLSLIGFIIIVILIINFAQIAFLFFRYAIHKSWPFRPFSFYLVVLFAITSIVSIEIINQIQTIEIEQRKKIAENLSNQEEEFGQNMIQIAMSNLGDDFLVGSKKRFYNEKTNKLIKDSIIGFIFRGYLNKYDTKVYVFDSTHSSLYNDDTVSYNGLKEIITCNSTAEGIDGLYSYTGKELYKNYILEKNLVNVKDTSLFVFVLAHPKSNYGNAIFPELFKQSNTTIIDRPANYNYAIYLNGYLEKHTGNTSFPNKIQSDKIFKSTEDYKQEISNKGTSELWYKAIKNKVIVVAQENDYYKDILTLFSYLLCLLVITSSLLKIGNKLFYKLFTEILPERKEEFKYHFQVQIQNAINIISILALTIIGFFTVSLFAERFKNSNIDRLSKSVQSIVEEIEAEIQSKLIYNDASNIHQLNEMDIIDKKILQISEIHAVDINLFDAEGNLKLSTQPYIYNKHLLNSKIDPAVFGRLKNNNYSSSISSEKIGLLNYLSIYSVIRDDNKKVIGYINIPYLNSQSELNMEVSNFLSTLINLNTFIFLLAGAISFLVSRRITSSLVLIGNKMKEISVGNINEPIQWDKNDEIGVLVKEYNKMLQQLDISARMLAKNERDVAWREMAKQVAHEIKNPLTPMKLSLQYLERSIDNGHNDVQALTKQVTKTLIEQIDQLAKIASDFSQFANIQNAHFEQIDIIDSLSSVVDLYRMDGSVNIQWSKPSFKVNVLADNTQICRVFSNLIKNAIEAELEMNEKLITINCTIENKYVTIAIIDNGVGIPTELQDKIFEPNFTTKTSGTGLGLAICRSIVENSNGKIGFESKQGLHTTFYVQLPIAVL